MILSIGGIIMDSEKNTRNNNNTQKSVSPILQFLASKSGRIVLTIIFAVIIYGIIFLLISTDNSIIVFVIGIACTFFGWQVLGNALSPLASFSNVLYIVISFMLSALIGLFVAPFWLGKKISNSVMKYVDAAVKTVIK